MTRTTVDIDATVLRELKEKATREGKSLGQVISEVAAVALGSTPALRPEPFVWTSRPMGARVEISDKDALYRALDG
ncbi:MAG: antitoxin [Actinomycetota bacterium]